MGIQIEVVMQWVYGESGGVEVGWDEEAERKNNTRKIQSWLSDLRSDLNSNFRAHTQHYCFTPHPTPNKFPNCEPRRHI